MRYFLVVLISLCIPDVVHAQYGQLFITNGGYSTNSYSIAEVSCANGVCFLNNNQGFNTYGGYSDTYTIPQSLAFFGLSNQEVLFRTRNFATYNPYYATTTVDDSNDNVVSINERLLVPVRPTIRSRGSLLFSR